MEKGTNKVYIYKYFYALIMFLAILILPFLLLTYENEYYEALNEYNDAVSYAVSEEFQFDETFRNQILDLQDKVEEAKTIQRYKGFVTIIMIIIFISLFNYVYINIGLKYRVLSNSTSMNLNKKLVVTVSIVEIVYLVFLLIFVSKEFIGINFWTLFFVNIIIVIFVIVLSLQIQYLLKPKTKESQINWDSFSLLIYVFMYKWLTSSVSLTIHSFEAYSKMRIIKNKKIFKFYLKKMRV